MPGLFWMDCVIPEREPVALEFRRALQTAWLKHYSGLKGSLFKFRVEPSTEVIDRIEFTKDEAP